MKGFTVRDSTNWFEQGVENAPKAFIGLFVGETLDKQLVKVILIISRGESWEHLEKKIT